MLSLITMTDMCHLGVAPAVKLYRSSWGCWYMILVDVLLLLGSSLVKNLSSNTYPMLHTRQHFKW